MTASMRIVVVGASSGLGRTIGLGLAERGARVALLARRKQRLDHAAIEAGNGAIAVACDVTDQHFVPAAATAPERRRRAMKAQGIILSIDDHLVEPPRLFEGRRPAKYADQAPKVITTEKGDDVW